MYDSKSKAAAISEHTKITLGVVIVLLGFASWLTIMFFQGDANAKAIEELKTKQDAISEIQTDIAVIKTQISIINHKLDEQGPDNEVDDSYSSRRKVREDR